MLRKPRYFLIFVVLLFGTPKLLSLNLQEVYQSALKTNELVSLAQLEVEESQAQIDRVTAEILPKLTLSGTYLHQDAPTSTIDSDLTTAKITLAQPLFRGFAEFAALRSAKSFHLSKQAQESHLKSFLFDRVARSFYQVLGDDQDLKNIAIALELTRKRSQEIATRVRSGRSRQSELASSESQAALLEAQFVTAEGKARQSKLKLAQLSGIAVTFPLEGNLKTFVLVPLEEYRNSLTRRADLQAMRLELETYDEAIAIAKGNHYPFLDLSGNYYLKRNGTLSDSRLDVGLTATFPLFSGGGISAEIRTKIIQTEKARIQLKKTERELENELNTLYQNLTSGLKAVLALSKATELAKKNFDALSKDFRYSQATNLEVIAAHSQFYEAQRSLDRTNFQNQSDYHSLNATIGRIE